MNKKILSLLLFSPLLLLIDCREPGLSIGGSSDDAKAINFFIRLINPENGSNLFCEESYSTDSLHLWHFFEDGTSSGPWFFQNSLYNQEDSMTVLNMQGVVRLGGGLGEPGTYVGRQKVFEGNTLLYFKNGDIDTIYTVARCHESCRFEHKSMQLYYNDELALDFDFRKDSVLIERLLENNVRPYKDTVIFTIFKRPEF